MLRHISYYTDGIVFSMFKPQAANDNIHEIGLAEIAGTFEDNGGDE